MAGMTPEGLLYYLVVGLGVLGGFVVLLALVTMLDDAWKD